MTDRAQPSKRALIMIHRDEVIQRIQTLAPEARRRFGVNGIWIFGSIVREEAKETSDVDIFVEFSSPATLDSFMGLKFFLEEHLEIRVDLATRNALHPRLRSRIEAEAIHVA